MGDMISVNNVARDSKVNSLNATLFPSNFLENNITELNEKLKSLQHEILCIYKKLADLSDPSKKIRTFTKEQLLKFFSAHQNYRLIYEDNFISLESVYQEINYQSASLPVGEQTIYCTLPCYSYVFTFEESGKVTAKANENSYRPSDPKNNSAYGHPNATVMDGNIFVKICQGNNRFISEYNDLCQNNRKDANELLRILSKCIIWLESANLSDMYDTLPCPKYSLPSGNINKDFAEEFFKLANNCQYPDQITDLFNKYNVTNFEFIKNSKYHRKLTYGLAYSLWFYYFIKYSDSHDISRDSLQFSILFDIRLYNELHLLRKEQIDRIESIINNICYAPFNLRKYLEINKEQIPDVLQNIENRGGFLW